MKEFNRYKVTYTLTLIIALLYLYSMIMSGSVGDISAQELVKIGGLYPPFVVFEGEWYRVIVSLFLHGGLMHVLLNSASLIIVGRVVEEYFNRLEYGVIYFGSGIIAALASIYFHPFNVLIGASGAIFGIFGALIGFFIAHRKAMMHQFKAVMQNIGVILLINLGMGIAFPSIDMVAHIAGLIFGVAAGLLYSWQRKLFWVYIALSIVGMVLFSQQLPEIIYSEYVKMQRME